MLETLLALSHPIFASWYGDFMKPLRAGAIVAAFILVVALVVITKPWKLLDSCHAPDEFCALASQLEDKNGVEATAVDYEVTAVDAKDGDRSTVSWTVELAEDLDSAQAGELASTVSAQVQSFIASRPLVQSSLRFVAGEPQESSIPDFKLYPLDVSDSSEAKAQVAHAFALRQLGAQKAGQNSATAENTQVLKALADYASSQGAPITLELADGSIRYTPTTEFDIARLDLALEAADLEAVESAIMDSSGLSVHTQTAADSKETAQIKKWLTEHEPLKEPMAFTLSSPGFADITEGWLGDKLPESLIARPVRLPDGVKPWPQDASAQTCTDKDLALSLGSPDAATGSRYMAVYAKNISGSACAVNGYPQIQFLNADGEPQQDVTLTKMPQIQSQRVVIPAGESIMSALQWKAMSTANDPDQTTALRISAAPGLEATELASKYEQSATSLDILDGGEVSQSPWVQALDGWPLPDSSG